MTRPDCTPSCTASITVNMRHSSNPLLAYSTNCRFVVVVVAAAAIAVVVVDDDDVDDVVNYLFVLCC